MSFISEFRFRVRIRLLTLYSEGSGRLIINGTSFTPLSPAQLKYQTTPLATEDGDIKYTVLESPKFGFLTRNPSLLPSRSSSFSNEPQFTFTQADLTHRRIVYTFKFTPYSGMNDYFVYNVTSTLLLSTQRSRNSPVNSDMNTGPFKFEIISTIPSRIPLQSQLRPLLVTEGGREQITSKILKIRISDERTLLRYNITGGPFHGIVEREKSSDYSTSVSITQDWESSELEKGSSKSLYYRHDGSETPKDRIELLAWNDEADFMYSCVIDIIIKGVNNHPPRRSPKANLRIEVVTGGVRRLSKEILDFTDEDWDSDPASLKYTTRGSGPMGNSPFGNIYDRFTSLSRPVFSWTQADIDAGKLVFKHEGSDTFSHGLLPFWVTDGKFIQNGTLEISAGAPWVKIVNTTTLAGKRGSMVRLSEDDIKIDTNVDVDQDRIIIRIIEGPTYGQIKINQSMVVHNFTLGDLNNRFVSYDNQAVHEIQRDSFRFEAVILNNAESPIGQFEIAIFPETYWAPLKIGANETIFVNENSSAFISQASLHILNPHIPPNDILYTLTRPPKHGYLAIDPINSLDESDFGDFNMDVKMWDQTLINENKLRYVQSDPNKTVDSMFFDVTNGVQTLRDLKLDFIIIPTNLILASSEIIVNEGGSQILNITHIHAAQNYFADKISDLKITTPPSHGTLSMITRANQSLLTFPWKALQDGKIIYYHDGSETLSDEFEVVAFTEDRADEIGLFPGRRILNPYPAYTTISSKKESLPYQIRIKIIPYNDQVPKIVNNTGAWIWAGGSIAITNNELAAVDDDAEKSVLTFYVVESIGGYPARKDEPKIPLQNFTQHMINTNQLIFVHKGLDFKDASMDIELSDGLYEAAMETFRIIVRKPDLTKFEGRVPLAVFPFTQVPIQPENLLVKSSDGAEVSLKLIGGIAGQLLIEGPGLGSAKSTYSPVSSFTQTDVNNGKIFYQHRKPLQGPKDKDLLRFTASSSYADPLEDVTVEVEISVSGAGALGSLQRYVSISPLQVKEGGQMAITTQNVNFSAIIDFMQSKGRNTWRGNDGPYPSLRLILSEGPKHGDLYWDRMRFEPPAAEVSPALLDARKLKYVHDDSETTEDEIGFSLFLWTVGNTLGKGSTSPSSKAYGNDSSIWLLNVTLPIHISPVNDQPFEFTQPKSPILAVIQEHWRKLSKNDLLTSDPDTPPAHLTYNVSRVSHGRFILLPIEPTGRLDNFSSSESIKELKTTLRFTQADVNAGRVIFYHTGPVTNVRAELSVSDGEHAALPIHLQIPVQGLTLQASQNQAFPLRISQGNSVMTLSSMNLPASTNGNLNRLVYNLTRGPLHGKILFRERISLITAFTHEELVRGELAYVQSDLSVANDSFEVSAHFTDISPAFSGSPNTKTYWLVNVVAVPLLKRVKEVRAFVRGFAVGGLIAPDESDFSVSSSSRTILNLALLDASPLAALTGHNPIYEILVPPKYGQLNKVQIPYDEHAYGQKRLFRRAFGFDLMMEDEPKAEKQKSRYGRIASRFSHEDIRRGLIIYSSTSSSSSSSLGFNENQFPNEIMISERGKNKAKGRGFEGGADEFIFRTIAPNVQPALAIAKFRVRNPEGHFYDEDPNSNDNEIISDGSTDLSTKRSRGRSGLRDITLLVTPKMSKDSLVKIAIIIGGAVTLGLLVVIGIQCTCSKKKRGVGSGNNRRNGGINNSDDPNPKCISNGMIDVYAPMMDPCHSDSDTGLSGNGGNNSMRPLMMSTSTLPRNNKGNNNINAGGGTLGRCRSSQAGQINQYGGPADIMKHDYNLQHRNQGNYTRAMSETGSWASTTNSNVNMSNRNSQIPTPSMPQCRVTPLSGGGHFIQTVNGVNSSQNESGSDSGGGYSGSNSLLMCPLLPLPNPAPICDTFGPLPEEIDPPEPYGFTYLPPPLELDGICDTREDETAFNEQFYNTNNMGENISMTMMSNSGHAPGQINQLGPGGNSGTLGRNKSTTTNIEKNQYWV